MPEETERKVDVAIVEDNAALGASLRKIVESASDFRCVGVWPSAEEALKKIDAFRPQVVLMDINLPKMSGIEATARIKRHLPDIQVIMVTVYRDHDQIFAALKAGASGYLIKRSTPEEVRQAIRDVRSGGAPMSAEIARRVVEAFHQPAPANEVDDVKLSKRETEILEWLTKGLANKEIADRLDISVETVRVHLRRVYEKLHVHSRTEAAMKFRDAKENPFGSI
ncbi:MAG: response regulator transcription factor [Verrucomicrobiae bacterium]|nr:response regulator transcription factor [Verrucomicrobiae bacterium]MCP5546726.1 response regulator transcription factor [Akkermansiaceae bacterium]